MRVELLAIGRPREIHRRVIVGRVASGCLLVMTMTRGLVPTITMIIMDSALAFAFAPSQNKDSVDVTHHAAGRLPAANKGKTFN